MYLVHEDQMRTLPNKGYTNSRSGAISSKFGLQEDVDRYGMDAKVCNYFAFPEQGIVVALRPGDSVLIFNPRYHHSLHLRRQF
jgi:hypothetical protein